MFDVSNIVYANDDRDEEKEDCKVDVIKLFGANLNFPKIKKFKKVWSETAHKCENNAAIFKQNYTLELFISFKIANSC